MTENDSPKEFAAGPQVEEIVFEYPMDSTAVRLLVAAGLVAKAGNPKDWWV